VEAAHLAYCRCLPLTKFAESRTVAHAQQGVRVVFSFGADPSQVKSEQPPSRRLNCKRSLDCGHWNELHRATRQTFTCFRTGDEALYQAAAAPLDVMGKAKFFLGGEGKGANMKLVVNAVMGAMMASFAEGMSLADQVGGRVEVGVEGVGGEPWVLMSASSQQCVRFHGQSLADGPSNSRGGPMLSDASLMLTTTPAAAAAVAAVPIALPAMLAAC